MLSGKEALNAEEVFIGTTSYEHKSATPTRVAEASSHRPKVDGREGLDPGKRFQRSRIRSHIYQPGAEP